MRQVIDTLTTRQELADQPFGSVEIKLSHLLAPTDFSPNSETAVDYAVQLARRLGTKLRCCMLSLNQARTTIPWKGLRSRRFKSGKRKRK
jgi:nucleotide-binding universal stress UspA family protein